MIAVWTHNWEKIDGVKIEHGSKEYVNRMEDFLEQPDIDFKNSDNLVICGDFNIDISIPEQKGRDKYVQILNDYGCESIYHKLKEEDFGQESIKTFYGNDGNFHMDYLFTKPEIVSSFKLGSKEEYIGPAKTDKSDHVPLIFEIDI